MANKYIRHRYIPENRDRFQAFVLTSEEPLSEHERYKLHKEPKYYGWPVRDAANCLCVGNSFYLIYATDVKGEPRRFDKREFYFIKKAPTKQG